MMSNSSSDSLSHYSASLPGASATVSIPGAFHHTFWLWSGSSRNPRGRAWRTINLPRSHCALWPTSAPWRYVFDISSAEGGCFHFPVPRRIQTQFACHIHLCVSCTILCFLIERVLLGLWYSFLLSKQGLLSFHPRDRNFLVVPFLMSF